MSEITDKLRKWADWLDADIGRDDPAGNDCREAADYIDHLEADKARLDWLETMTVNVRHTMRYGSHDLFWANPDDSYEGEIGPSDIRKQIDAALTPVAETPNQEPAP